MGLLAIQRPETQSAALKCPPMAGIFLAGGPGGVIRQRQPTAGSPPYHQPPNGWSESNSI